MDRVCLLFLYFFIYSVLGWICVTAYCSIGKRQFVNRGFLNGPLCPVYGFGALAVIWLLRPVCEYPILVFVAGAVVTSVLEYLTGYLLEKLFGLKLWDYSKRPFHIRGRVCLRNSLLFGLLSLLLVEFLHPVLHALLQKIPPWLLDAAAVVLFVLLLVDLAVTVCTVLQISDKLGQIGQVLEELNERNAASLQQIGKRFNESMDALKEHQKERQAEAKERIDQLNARLSELLTQKRMQRRIFKAFPNMQSKKHQETLDRFKELANQKRKKKRKKKS